MKSIEVFSQSNYIETDAPCNVAQAIRRYRPRSLEIHPKVMMYRSVEMRFLTILKAIQISVCYWHLWTHHRVIDGFSGALLVL